MKVVVTMRTGTARLVNNQIAMELAQSTSVTLAASRPTPTAGATADSLVHRADSTLLRADRAA